MDDLLSRFRTEHQLIVDSIDQMQMVTRSYVQAKPVIRRMSNLLLHYFGKQDELFYQELRLACQANREDLKIIEFLVLDLKDIKVKYLIFFDKYTGEMGDLGKAVFPREFTEFSRDLLARIRSEEDYLFPLLAKHQKLDL